MLHRQRLLVSEACPVFAVFNVGQYRRDAAGTYNSFEFFKPDNAEAMKIRRCAVGSAPPPQAAHVMRSPPT